MTSPDDVRRLLDAALRQSEGARARFALVVADHVPDGKVAEALAVDLAAFAATVERRGANELMLVLHDRALADETAAFRFADAMVATYELEAAEPEVFFNAMPVDLPSADPRLESAGELLGCWAPEEAALATRQRWALEALRMQRAWDFAAANGRPHRGEGIVIAQPDTGITRHPELQGVTLVAQRNLIGLPRDDATDPLSGGGNPGHGTSTSSVVVSPETLAIAGSAPRARLMPIRAIESVALLSQLKVAEAIDHAVDNGAHIITMSLGGLASISLWRALSRAVDAGVIVLAAAGNCVGFVVWPARYEKCIAVAGVNSDDRVWQGSCRGGAVDVSAPAQNVYRATARDRDVGQGQGTSYAVALTAGVAACWLAFHGRANAIAEARRRGETLQDMFRRLLRATARVPSSGWDAFNLGAGIVDAGALLAADLDLGRGTEAPSVPFVLESPGLSVRSLAYEDNPAAIGLESTEPDWEQGGTEISLEILRRRLAPRGISFEPPETPSPPKPARPALRRRAEAPSDGVSRMALRQRRLIVTRAAAEEGTLLESAAADIPLTRHQADATLDRVVSLATEMPPSEVGDRQAFAAALRLLKDHGRRSLGKLVADDRPEEMALTSADTAVLEAIIIADGSRPSFLIEGGLPPAVHPFMGEWQDRVTAARPRLKPLCDAIGRVQTRNGHAGSYVGTGCLVDAAAGIVLTNYHVLDDARTRFGVLMEQTDHRVRVDGWLEVDFVGEAASFDARRFRVVEAMLPRRYGRGIGRLDAAALRVEPLDDAAMPDAIRFDPTATALNQAAGTSFCTVGFPGPPLRNQGPRGEVDWDFVVRTLFGNLFGVKRLAPGRIRELRGVDSLGIVFGHEATTFGGASGSALLAWEMDTLPGFGLHFSGATEVSNYAVEIGRVADDLRAVGVPL